LSRTDKINARGIMGAEETIVRGVDSSAISWAKNDIEYDDNQRYNQHRKFYKAG
jgi:hypothetical protein